MADEKYYGPGYAGATRKHQCSGEENLFAYRQDQCLRRSFPSQELCVQGLPALCTAEKKNGEWRHCTKYRKGTCRGFCKPSSPDYHQGWHHSRMFLRVHVFTFSFLAILFNMEIQSKSYVALVSETYKFFDIPPPSKWGSV